MKLLKYLVVIYILFLINGCNNDDKNKNKLKPNLGQNIRMEKGVPYEVNKGDQIEKISDNPNLKIESNLETGKTVVMLISGEAAIIKADSK